MKDCVNYKSVVNLQNMITVMGQAGMTGMACLKYFQSLTIK